MLTNYSTSLTIIIISYITIYKIYQIIILFLQINNYIYLINLLTLPVMICFLLFPINFCITNMILPFLSARYLLSNSKYYSSFMRYNKNKLIDLPSITINVPVYDEDFKKVIKHTLRSCIAARNKYQNYGGKCNIVVNDDGIMKFINNNLSILKDNKFVTERILYYKKHNIGFTARSILIEKVNLKKLVI